MAKMPWEARLLNRPVRAERTSVRFRACYEGETRARLAESVLTQDGAVVVRSGCEVQCVWSVTPRDALRINMHERRIRQLLSDAGLDPEAAELFFPPPLDRSRTWHTLTLTERRIPAEDERAVLQRAPRRLEPAGAVIPHPELPQLKWVDHTSARYFPRTWALVLLGLVTVFVAASVGLAGTGGYISAGVVGGAILALIGAAGWAWSVRSWPRRVGRGLGGLALVGLMYGAGISEARTAPKSIAWDAAGALLLAVFCYVGVMLAVLSAIPSSLRSVRAVSKAVIAAVAGVGATGLLLELPRELLQAGLDQHQTRLAISPAQALSTVDPQILVISGIALVLLAVGGVVLLSSTTLPPAGVAILLPLLASGGVALVVPAGLSIYTTGTQLRNGDMSHAGWTASCVQTPDRVDLTTARWSPPAIIVGSPTGPSLTIDPRQPDQNRVTRTQPIATRNIESKRCTKTGH